MTDAEPVSLISTGDLPAPEAVALLVGRAYENYRTVDEGAVADYIPALADTDPDLFGLAVVGAKGRSFSIGDADHEFSVQSVSKPFVFALVCDAIGSEIAHSKLGANATGMAFNSVMAIEMNDQRTMNPMVNAGAIATTSLVPGESADAKWEYLRDGLSRFAGRELELDEAVYASESAANQRNRGVAHLLESYDRMYFDPDEATDVYTRQCSVRVTAHDLAVMGATLANGGRNPITREQVVNPTVCGPVLAVLASAGMYENSGDWLFEVGLPAKSGVSGGIVTMVPGKGSLASFSPRLDAAGNSVRGQLAVRDLSQTLGLNLFASRAEASSPD